MRFLVYYGCEVPRLERTRELAETLVVLQDYHPILASGLYEDCFPRCRRFAYWDPTSIQRREYEALDAARLPTRGHDAKWDTVLLDLSVEACRELVLGRAARLLEVEGVQGLFVDNLDLWAGTPSDRKTMRGVLEALDERTGGVPVFVNRGFAFWPRLARLEAVLLESLVPKQIASVPASHLPWIESLLPLFFEPLAARAVPVFGLSYESPAAHEAAVAAPSDNAAWRLALVERLSRYVTETVYGDESLAQWPQTLLA